MKRTGILIALLIGCLAGYTQDFSKTLQANKIGLSVRINQYDQDRYNLLINRQAALFEGDTSSLIIQNTEWQISKEVAPLEKAGKYKIAITFKCLSGKLNNASVSVDINFDNWSKDNYVLMPAAVYNGNRYETVRMDYMPFFTEVQLQTAVTTPIMLSDQPRLNFRDGYSRIQDRSGSMALPAMGFYSHQHEKGVWICISQGNHLGDYGLDVEENKARDKAIFTITSPVVREQQKYAMARMDVLPSDDVLANFQANDKVTISFIIDLFDGENLQSLYDELIDLRTKHYPTLPQKKMIPFSAVFPIIEKHKNLENWRSAGFYSSGVNPDIISDGWRAAWVGGLPLTYALLAEGNVESKQNALVNLNWLYPNGISPSGFYFDKTYDGQFTGVKPTQLLMRDLTLSRISAGAVYYAFKQFDLLKKQNHEISPIWVESNIRTIKAFVNIWKKHGQMGQWVNQQSGELVVGNTTSAGIFPAALCQAYRFTGDDGYLQLAQEVADYFYANFVSKGLVCGGPGDAMQSFDSESSYALVESYIELYEMTGQPKWLKYAKEMANQFSTWVVSYDYQFPENTVHGKMSMQTTGTVYANTQNKHTSAGICTHSGIALLKLYRATQNPFYLNLLCDIAHAIPQYMSFEGNQIPGFKDGWISERINMTDWQSSPPIGGVMVSSNWNEIAMLLTATELPGIYVNKTTKEVFVLDHVQARLDKKGKLEISNPTKYDAVVKVLAETSGQMRKPLGQNAFMNWEKVNVPAGKTIAIKI